MKVNPHVKNMHWHLQLHLDALLNHLPSRIFLSICFLLLILSPRPPIFNETPINPIPDSPIEEDPTTSTKIETMPVETSAVDSSLINHNPNPLVTRANARVSAEYLTQHINYRAQRLAAKVEPGMVNSLCIFQHWINTHLLDNTKTSCSYSGKTRRWRWKSKWCC